MSLFTDNVGFFRRFGVVSVGEMIGEIKMRNVLVY